MILYESMESNSIDGKKFHISCFWYLSQKILPLLVFNAYISLIY